MEEKIKKLERKLQRFHNMINNFLSEMLSKQRDKLSLNIPVSNGMIEVSRIRKLNFQFEGLSNDKAFFGLTVNEMYYQIELNIKALRTISLRREIELNNESSIYEIKIGTFKFELVLSMYLDTWYFERN